MSTDTTDTAATSARKTSARSASPSIAATTTTITASLGKPAKLSVEEEKALWLVQSLTHMVGRDGAQGGGLQDIFDDVGMVKKKRRHSSAGSHGKVTLANGTAKRVAVAVDSVKPMVAKRKSQSRKTSAVIEAAAVKAVADAAFAENAVATAASVVSDPNKAVPLADTPTTESSTIKAQQQEQLSDTGSTSTKKTARKTKATATTTDSTKPTDVQDSSLPPREPRAPKTTLSFAINEAKWQAARDAPDGSPESYFTYQHYQGPATVTRADGSSTPEPVQVHYCKTIDEMERVCATYFANEPVVGVDLEWMVWVRKALQDDPRQHVSLIQMSSPSRIALFHLAMFKTAALDSPDGGGTMDTIPTPDDLVAPTFRAMMEDPGILKLGVCILGDANRMKKHLAIDTVGTFELSHLWKVVRYRPHKHLHKKVNRSPVKLATQVEDILGLPMYKAPDVRASNWTRPLTEAQIECKGFFFSIITIVLLGWFERLVEYVCVSVCLLTTVFHSNRLGYGCVCVHSTFSNAGRRETGDGFTAAAAGVCRVQRGDLSWVGPECYRG